MLDFFNWLLDGLKKVIDWLVGLPGMIVSVVLSLTTAVSSLWSFVSSQISIVETFCDSISSQIQNLNTLVSSNEYFSFFVYVFSLDVAWGYVVDVLGLFILGVSTVIVGGVVLLVAYLVHVSLFKAGAKAINAIVPFIHV